MPESMANPEDEFTVAELAPVDSETSAATTATFNLFDPRNISVEKTSGGIFTGVVGLGLIVGGLFVYFSLGWDWPLWICLAIALPLYAGLFWFTFFWPAIEHRHRGWCLTDVGLEFRHGVWFKHRHAIPWARVQHSDVSQGPLQRMYGIGTLTVHTAGTSNSSVNLAGLSHELAIELRDEILKQRAREDAV